MDAENEAQEYVESLHETQVTFLHPETSVIYERMQRINPSISSFSQSQITYTFRSGIPDRIVKPIPRRVREDTLVLEKVIGLLESLHKPILKVNKVPVEAPEAIQLDIDDDIFADAGREYVPNATSTSTEIEMNVALPTGFTISKPLMEDTSLTEDTHDVQVPFGLTVGDGELATVLKRLHSSKEQEEIIDPDRLEGFQPISNMEDEYDVMMDDRSDDEADLTQLDHGYAQNKKNQKSRFDFETHEEWVTYKETQVHMPKAAFQFGQKSVDKVKSKSSSDKFNREFQQLDNMFQAKYGSELRPSKEDGKKEKKQSSGSFHAKKRRK